jgi:hypothetical protein
MVTSTLMKSAIKYSHAQYNLRYTAILSIKENLKLFDPTSEKGPYYVAYLKAFLVDYIRDYNQQSLIYGFLRKQNKEDREVFERILKEKHAPQFIKEFIKVPKEYVTLISLIPHDFYLMLEFYTKPNISPALFIDQVKTDSSKAFRKQFPETIIEPIWDQETLLFTSELAGQHNMNEFKT